MLFSLNWALGQFSLKVAMFVCGFFSVFAIVWNLEPCVYCRLLLKDCTVKLAKLSNHIFWKVVTFFGSFYILLGLGVNRLVPQENMSVLAKQPTVRSGGVSMGRVCGCGCWR